MVLPLNSLFTLSKPSAMETMGIRKPRKAAKEGRVSPLAVVKMRRNTKGSSPTTSRTSPMVAKTAPAPVRKTSSSSRRMRVLERLSPSSFIITVPAPARAEPSRRIGNTLEKARIDVVQARMACVDHGEIAARAHHGPGDVAANVSGRLDAQARALMGHAGDAGHG